MLRRVHSALFCLLLIGCGSSSGGGAPGGASSGGGSDSGGTNTGGVGTGGSGGTAGSAEHIGGSGGAAAGSGPAGAAGAAGAAGTKRAPYATHIACNSAANYVVLSDGRSYSWAGTRGDYAPSDTYATVSAGGAEACHLLKDGTITCLDSGSPVAKNVPAGKFTDLRLGVLLNFTAACARNAAGLLTCWGEDADPIVTQAPAGPVTAFDMSASSACAIAQGGAVSCWGSQAPAAPTNKDFASVYSNAPFSCGISSAGAMTCWTFNTQPTPNIEQLSIGPTFACLIQAGGHGFCFNRQSGDTSVPQPPAGTSFTEITTGDSRACGILVDGSVICWGEFPNNPLVQPPPDPIRAF